MDAMSYLLHCIDVKHLVVAPKTLSEMHFGGKLVLLHYSLQQFSIDRNSDGSCFLSKLSVEMHILFPNFEELLLKLCHSLLHFHRRETAVSVRCTALR